MKAKQVFAAFCCISALILAGYQLIGQEKKLPVDGPSKTYRVMTPKPGFIGSPPSARAYPDFRKPSKAEDFDTFFIRITVVDEQEINGGIRKIMQIDQIDERGRLVHEGLYYAHLDTLPEGTRIIPLDSRHMTEVGPSHVAFGIPFPFICARPPALGSHKKTHDGYVNYRTGLGVKYKEIPSVVWIEATFFQTAREAEQERRVQWYGSDIDDVVDAAKTRAHFREKQKWLTADDWLWEEMERFDDQGNLMMRCTRIE